MKVTIESPDIVQYLRQKGVDEVKGVDGVIVCPTQTYWEDCPQAEYALDSALASLELLRQEITRLS